MSYSCLCHCITLDVIANNSREERVVITLTRILTNVCTQTRPVCQMNAHRRGYAYDERHSISPGCIFLTSKMVRNAFITFIRRFDATRCEQTVLVISLTAPISSHAVWCSRKRSASPWSCGHYTKPVRRRMDRHTG